MSRKTLENIVKRHGKDNHVRHHDPLDKIAHHVIALVFICMLFLFSVFMFLTADQTPESAVTYAIIEFDSITFHTEFIGSISEFIDRVRYSENRSHVLLTLYTFWIIIFGLVNMVLYERSLKK